MKTREDKTIQYYDNSAHEWIGKRDTDMYWSEEMQKLQSYLPNGKLLEIGSGSGKEATLLVKLGYEYTGTDASKGLIETAQTRNPGAKFMHVSVYDLDLSDKFDGFWTAATLLHIPKDRIDEALQAIKKSVNPEGIGFISLKEGVGESEDPKTERWFAYYSQDEFSNVLKRNGFEILEQSIRPHEDQNRENWLLFWVRTK